MIKKDWENETVAIVASGPSVTLPDAHLTMGNAKVIAVNDSWKLCPWADILYAADYKWWQHHDYVKYFAGEKWTQNKGYKSWPDDATKNGLTVVNSVHNTTSFSFDPSVIHTGLNSGFQAINIAVLKGAKRILLLGFDYEITKDKTHWFGDHPPKLRKKSPYDLFRKAIHSAAPGLLKRGVEVINCSLNSSIQCFPKRKIVDVI